MHPFAAVLSYIYLSDLRAEADAERMALLAARAPGRRSGVGRLGSLRRALGSISGRIGPRSLDLPATA
ncbi:MAG TPA: hypothetical protein VEY67_11210 [Candidatus Dormibacteraeota bacterium]|nr:hypothetical protein [Candidatus Dormibacteraeota bacterium]